MKYIWVVLIFCAGCTCRRGNREVHEESLSSKAKARIESSKPQDKELEKINHWFEQTDAIFREAMWVIRKQRAPVDKSIFGKFHRALMVNQNQKLANKSIFKCDVYTMRRDVQGLSGVPQVGHAYHRCHSKENFIHIGSWSHPKPHQMSMRFVGANLGDALGFTTSFLNPQISCKLVSNDVGVIETFSCENLMVDYDSSKNQVLKFHQFAYVRSGQSLLYIKAEVLENLEVIRKIEVKVPLEGNIQVTETVVAVPEYIAKEVPTVTPTAPAATPLVLAPQAPQIQDLNTPVGVSPIEAANLERRNRLDNMQAPEVAPGFEGSIESGEPVIAAPEPIEAPPENAPPEILEPAQWQSIPGDAIPYYDPTSGVAPQVPPVNHR